MPEACTVRGSGLLVSSYLADDCSDGYYGQGLLQWLNMLKLVQTELFCQSGGEEALHRDIV